MPLRGRGPEPGLQHHLREALATEPDQCQATSRPRSARAGGSHHLQRPPRGGQRGDQEGPDVGRARSHHLRRFHDYLDVEHGASYFRRWHGKKRFSGSLLVHKASHHFDQMNWWLEAEPHEVHAFGGVESTGKRVLRSRRCRGYPPRDRSTSTGK